MGSPAKPWPPMAPEARSINESRDLKWSANDMGMGQNLLYNTIFSGMNIHLPAILMFTRGTRVLTHPHMGMFQFFLSLELHLTRLGESRRKAKDAMELRRLGRFLKTHQDFLGYPLVMSK